MIIFKNYDFDARNFVALDLRLATVVETMEAIAWARWREPLVCTSISRNDGSTHANPPPYRFIDFALLVRGDSEVLRNVVNVLFTRTDGRETVVPLDHGTAPHFHVQVGPAAGPSSPVNT